MRIFLLNPPFIPKYSRQSRSPAKTKGATLYYPYFLSYSCGVLEQSGFKVKLLDSIAKNLSHEETLKIIKKFNPSLVVIDTSTPSIINDVDFASRIKDELKNVHINLVGTHPTYLPKETLKMSDKIDSVCIWEYDYIVRDLALALEKKKNLESVDGLCFRKGKKIIRNKPRPLIKNLDELPFISQVYKKHLDVKDYFYASVEYPQVTILTARGCLYNCTFCNSPFKGSYRPRTVKNVVEEFEFIQNELPEVREVMVEDETFPAVKSRTIKLCNEMIKRKNSLKWSCNARVDTDYETLKKMKEAGCRLLCVGFESPTQGVLDSIRKGTTKNTQIEFMENCNKLGLLVNGCFMLGLPGDTKETIKRTIEFAKLLNPDTAQFYPLMVYPGLAAYEWVNQKGYLATEDYSKWLTKEGWHNCVIDRPGLSGEELVKTCDQARLEFYLRPAYFFKRLKLLSRGKGEIKRIFKASNAFFRYILTMSGKK
ncbi:MAG: radical SAM protein [Candidatus Aenigmarchaeota archaeon]|nr:radical SAM protein [Candidatus Aenigmarchaeota archaeon]